MIKPITSLEEPASSSKIPPPMFLLKQRPGLGVYIFIACFVIQGLIAFVKLLNFNPQTYGDSWMAIFPLNGAEILALIGISSFFAAFGLYIFHPWARYFVLIFASITIPALTGVVGIILVIFFWLAMNWDFAARFLSVLPFFKLFREPRPEVRLSDLPTVVLSVVAMIVGLVWMFIYGDFFRRTYESDINAFLIPIWLIFLMMSLLYFLRSKIGHEYARQIYKIRDALSDLKADPVDQSALFKLSMLFQIGDYRDPQQALLYLKRLMEIAPDHPRIAEFKKQAMAMEKDIKDMRTYE